MTQVLTVAPAHDYLDQGKGITDVDGTGVTATEVNQQFLNSGSEVLAVSNGGVGALTVTVKGVPDPYGRSVDEATIIPAGKVGIITFANPAMFNSGGAVNVVLSGFTSVKLLLCRFRKNR